LSDDQYRLLEPLIPPAKAGGRPRATDMRRLLDSLFYLLRTGCQWRHLPPPPVFLPWPTVSGYFRAFLSAGVWDSMRHHLVVMLREGAGREPSPTAAIVDTQSVKTTESGGPRGYDAAKKVKGRMRHIAVDTQGLLLGVLVHVASIQDADGAGDLLRRIKPLYCWLQTVFADSIYNRVAALLACFLLGLTLLIIRRVPGMKGFVVLPRRWVVISCTKLPSRASSGWRPLRARNCVLWHMLPATLGRGSTGCPRRLGRLPMEEWMVHAKDRPRLELRESFETTRLGPQCLIKAYTRLVPIRRVKAGDAGQERADALPRKKGGKHA